MLTAALLLALAATEPGPSRQSLVDDVGRTVAIAATPRRIVSTAPSNTAALFALGVGDRVVGVTSYCTYPPEAADRTKVGDFSSIDLETLIALEPDLVVATWLEQKRMVERMEALGLTVLVLYPKSLEETMRSLLTLGQATGTEAAAKRLTDAMRVRLEAIDARVAALADERRPRVFVQLGTSPLYTAGPGSTVHEAIARAGGDNIAGDLSKPYATISREVVIARDPEIVLLGMGAGEDAASVAAQPGFADLSAVRADRVHVVDPGLLFQQNQRLVDGIELLVELLHRPAPAELQP